jgi:periplasmic protein TonB
MRGTLRITLLVFCFFLAGLSAAPADAQQTDSPPLPKITRIRQGGNITAKMLKHKVQPKYPKEARDNGIQGTVRLHAVIARDGTVAQLEVVSGHPLLVQSALDAVRQWKYRPTLLNGVPVEVDTTIDVIYSLNR